MKKLVVLACLVLSVFSVASANPIAPTEYYQNDNRYVCINNDMNETVLLLDTSKNISCKPVYNINGDKGEMLVGTVVAPDNMNEPKTVYVQVFHGMTDDYGKLSYDNKKYNNFREQEDFNLYWFLKDYAN